MSTQKPRALILKNGLSPGDILVMTAAIHSLHKAHPGKYLTAVDTPCPALFEHNPDVASLEEVKAAQGEEIATHYPAVNECNQRGIHFMQGYCEFFSHALQVPVPLATNRPMVYLSEQEKGWMDQCHEATGRKQKFWLLCGGRKADYTAKFYGAQNFQRVVDELRGKVTFVQVGSFEHHHPQLKGVIDFRGKTDLRQLVRLAYHAEGAVGGVTLLMHLMAALEKPYVCVMGGREPVPWNSYPRQQLLHTVGMLPCCREGGCWRSRTVRLGDGAAQDSSLCDSPVPGDEPIPRCMAMIDPGRVADSVLSFYHGGVLTF